MKVTRRYSVIECNQRPLAQPLKHKTNLHNGIHCAVLQGKNLEFYGLHLLLGNASVPQLSIHEFTASVQHTATTSVWYLQPINWPCVLYMISEPTVHKWA